MLGFYVWSENWEESAGPSKWKQIVHIFFVLFYHHDFSALLVWSSLKDRTELPPPKSLSGDLSVPGTPHFRTLAL